MRISPAILYAPCPCGSGKKFKFCHLEEVRNLLPDDPTPSAVTQKVRQIVQLFGMINDVDPIEDREAIHTMFAAMKDRDAGRSAVALSGFRKAREMAPKLFSAWNNESLCLWMMKRFSEAVERQEEGLALSADINAFGWAQLATMDHCLGRDSARDLALDRAKAIKPISADAAVKVCEALALAGRHRELLDYALGSGFADTPGVALLSGIAAANCGRREKALELLRSIPDEDRHADRAGEVAAEVSAGNKATVSPLGTWPYFLPETYFGMFLVPDALEKHAAEHRNILCDLIEMMSAAGKMPDNEAVGILASIGGPRAGALLDAIQKRMPAPKKSDGKIIRKRGAPDSALDPNEPGVTRHFVSCASFEENPMRPADDKMFQRASHAVNTSRPGTKTFAKGRKELEALLARYPDYHRLEFNCAVALLRDGERDEAVRRFEKIVAEHPDYAFARSALLDTAVLAGDFARAKELVDGYRFPSRVHPLEMQNWYQAVLRYAEATDAKDDARFARENLDMLQKAFPDL